MKRVFGICLVVLLAEGAPRGLPGSRESKSIRLADRTQMHGDALVPAPDLDQRLAKWRSVKMKFDSPRLSPQERRLVTKLVEASQYLERIFWRQSDSEGWELLKSLQNSKKAQDLKLRRLLLINGCRWDLIAGNTPFVGSNPWLPGHGLYPPELKRSQIEPYVKEHPEKKAEIYNPYTTVHRQTEGSDELVGVPYHEAYQDLLQPAAKALREAAELSEDKPFSDFLRLRAAALLSDDYYQSDIAWLDLKDPKFDVIMAPYETYLDDVLGVKTSYGAAVLIRNEEESKKLRLYQRYVPEIQDALPIAAQDRPSKRGHLTPMEMMDAPYRGGDLRHGYQAVADNLPNDPRVHREKGSKKIFFKNFMDARVDYVILPLARKLMRADQAAKASGEGYLTTTVLHEISHELGPAYARRGGSHVDIREAVGPIYSGLEEAKADVVGMFGLKWLVARGALPQARLEEYYASYIAGILRTVRYGTAEAHGQAEMMEFNDLSQERAVVREASGRYAVDYARIPDAVAALARELLEIEAAGDRARAEAWFQRYDTMPSDLASALKTASEIPVDIDPVFAFSERVE